MYVCVYHNSKHGLLDVHLHKCPDQSKPCYFMSAFSSSARARVRACVCVCFNVLFSFDMMKTVSFYILQLFSMVCRMKLIRNSTFFKFYGSTIENGCCLILDMHTSRAPTHFRLQ